MIDDPVLTDDWLVVGQSEDLKEGDIQAVRLLGQDLVLWRVNSQVLAWQDLCVHRGVRLSLGKVVGGDKLECPYHGWTYNTKGQCIKMPAHPEQTPSEKAHVKSYQVREQYNLLWVSLGEPEHDVPPLPEWDDTEFRKIPCGPYKLKANGPRIIENFLDIAHFPFVHEGILGDRGQPEIEDYEAEIGPDGVTSKGVRVYQPDPFGTGEGETVAYTYRAYRPLTACLTKESDGPRFSIFLTITPHDILESTAWIWMAQNYGHDIPEDELIAYQDEIFAQDVPIVESQRPELLPLDLQAELHLRSDRTAIAYRKWLNELGLTFGAA
ncbi:MAG: aromatic ring-hydroxylating dioxygenase subunit alpha [Chloroflexi bacterium]|nr:MAG: aromatic ring-hydroxylating dioxygenase subunit alpha [Chloroflexota bacterium]MBL1196706.1 aromatic ring-hydroxylating dioxygenase subunit alpha [Chloroflexota bacterium]NOH13999.1 aromatic ring-hydroxylating dioxygenase subunit alpha [Chloroflexota bacterium]